MIALSTTLTILVLWSAPADAVSESKLAERKTLGETSATCPDKWHYIPVRCAPVLAVLAVMHAFCLRPDYRYLVCRIATYLSVFYNPIAISSKFR